jgi:hypothetical protein
MEGVLWTLYWTCTQTQNNFYPNILLLYIMSEHSNYFFLLLPKINKAKPKKKNRNTTLPILVWCQEDGRRVEQCLMMRVGYKREIRKILCQHYKTHLFQISGMMEAGRGYLCWHKQCCSISGRCICRLISRNVLTFFKFSVQYFGIFCKFWWLTLFISLIFYFIDINSLHLTDLLPLRYPFCWLIN